MKDIVHERARLSAVVQCSVSVRPPLSPREVVVSSPDSSMLRTGAWLAQGHRVYFTRTHRVTCQRR